MAQRGGGISLGQQHHRELEWLLHAHPTDCLPAAVICHFSSWIAPIFPQISYTGIALWILSRCIGMLLPFSLLVAEPSAWSLKVQGADCRGAAWDLRQFTHWLCSNFVLSHHGPSLGKTGKQRNRAGFCWVLAESRPTWIQKESIVVFSCLYLTHLDTPSRTLSRSPDLPTFQKRFGQWLWPWSECSGCCPVRQRGCTRKCKRHISEANRKNWKNMKACCAACASEMCKTPQELGASWSILELVWFFFDFSLIYSSAFEFYAAGGAIAVQETTFVSGAFIGALVGQFLSISNKRIRVKISISRNRSGSSV